MPAAGTRCDAGKRPRHHVDDRRPRGRCHASVEAADPRSQYATAFEEVSGKNPFLVTFSMWGSSSAIVLLNEFRGVLVGELPGNAAALLLNRMVRNVFAFTGSLIRATRRVCLMHWWHMKKSRDNRGAVRRSPSNIEAIEERCTAPKGERVDTF